MNTRKLLTSLVALGFWATVSQAEVVVLDFEGIGNVTAVGNYYNGGAGTNYGIQFSPNALAVVDADAGGTGNIGGEPSPDTALFFLTGAAATMNVAAGFDTGFSFFYSAINNPGTITVWDGLDGTGNLLATLVLPLTPFNGAPDPTGQFSPFNPFGVGFTGTARSVDFGGTVNQIAFDNITLGAAVPSNPSSRVPDAGSSALLLLGSVAGLMALARRK